MTRLLEDFFHFLKASPTSWHAAEQAALRLATLDFSPLEEEDLWHIAPGQNYFTIRGGAFAAFRLPPKKPKSLTILAAHTDSPGLKVKPFGQMHRAGFATTSLEVYGSPLLSSWLNRDLAIAGKICVKEHSGKITSHLVHVEEMPLTIPQIAIHLKKEQAEKGVLVHKQEQLHALYGLENLSEKSITKILKEHVNFQDLLSFDLRLVPLESPRYLGQKQELIASYRIDNLTGCFAALAGMGGGVPADDHLTVCVFWDHEEIGSGTNEGALSSFLSDCLLRIYEMYNLSQEERMGLKHRGLCLSLDMAHGVHPNYEGEKVFDPEHAPQLGKGIVIKSHAGGKYASDPMALAKLIDLMHKYGISHQYYVPRGDLPPGSTVGPLMAQVLGMKVIDLGLAQLSMHSIREIISSQDVELLAELIQLYVGAP